MRYPIWYPARTMAMDQNNHDYHDLAWWCLQELAFWFSLANGSLFPHVENNGFWLPTEWSFCRSMPCYLSSRRPRPYWAGLAAPGDAGVFSRWSMGKSWGRMDTVGINCANRLLLQILQAATSNQWLSSSWNMSCQMSENCHPPSPTTIHHPNELPFIGHFFNLQIKFPWIVTG